MNVTSTAAPQPDDHLDLRIVGVFVVWVASMLGAVTPVIIQQASKRALASDSTNTADAPEASTQEQSSATRAGIEMNVTAPEPRPDDGHHHDGHHHHQERPRFRIGYTQVIQLLSAVGTGSVLAAGPVHVAPIAADALARTLGSSYPWSEAIGVTTAMLVFFADCELHELLARKAARALKRSQSMFSAPDAAVGDKDRIEREMKDTEAILQLHILEIGIAVHSVLVGLTAGVLTDRSQIQALMIALCFHQFCDGISVGSAVAQTPCVTRLHAAALFLIYSLTTPAGLAIGIGVQRGSGDVESYQSLLATGVLSSVAYGILLNIGFTEMLPMLLGGAGGGGHSHGVVTATPEVDGAQPQCGGEPKPPAWFRVLMYLGVVFGSGALMVIAYWA